jgi:hypothetical protein
LLPSRCGCDNRWCWNIFGRLFLRLVERVVRHQRGHAHAALSWVRIRRDGRHAHALLALLVGTSPCGRDAHTALILTRIRWNGRWWVQLLILRRVAGDRNAVEVQLGDGNVLL